MGCLDIILSAPQLETEHQVIFTPNGACGGTSSQNYHLHIQEAFIVAKFNLLEHPRILCGSHRAGKNFLKRKTV
jgi:hypothetical protein